MNELHGAFDHATMTSEIYYDSGHTTVLEAGGRLTFFGACVCDIKDSNASHRGNTP